ncbi:MAG: hypothetical protein ABSD31_17580, partial [Candidatus Binataceae bacterium]
MAIKITCGAGMGRLVRAAAVALLALGGLLCASAIQAQTDRSTLPSRADFDVWLTKYANAKPDFKPGDILTERDIERIRPFIPPGYLDQLNFAGFKMEIAPSEDHTPRADFQSCSEKFQSQVRLSTDG